MPGLAAIIVAQQVSTASASGDFRPTCRRAYVPLEAAELAQGHGGGACAPADCRRRRSARCGRSLRRSARAASISRASAVCDAEDAHKALVAVKGVGPWTADIFLLFCLGHPDAFPAGDLALQEAARLALNLKRVPTWRKLERIAERWRPWRGVAARMLWAYYRGVKARSGMALADTFGAKPETPHHPWSECTA